jgi:anti-sigma regulatory factor (Ser/Thr protein kinase)
VDGDLIGQAAQPGRPLPEAGPGPGTGQLLLEQDFDGSSLYSLRAAVSAHAAAAGLTGNRLYDVVMTAHELAANAVRHGAGHGRLRLWLAQEVLYCEVSDDGRAAVAPAGNPCNDEAIGESQPPAGDQPGRAGPAGTGDSGVPWPEQHGHGLWVIGQVADQFTVDRRAGTTAIAAFSLGGAASGEAVR